MTQPRPSDHRATAPDIDPEARESADELARYGIVAVPLISYEWGGFRYSNAGDALAAAKRAER